MTRKPSRREVLASTLAAAAGMGTTALAQRLRFRIRTPVSEELVTDHGGYRKQLYTAFGMNTVGGRGTGTTPKVYRVTTTADTGAAAAYDAGTDSYTGEYRAALQASGPRFVVFETSGTITLSSGFNVTNPYLTVAGQTAPSPGIQIRDFTPSFMSPHTVLQHLRLRPGTAVSGDYGQGVETWTGSNNVLIDHCTIQFAVDEGIGTVVGATGGMTIWRCLIAESLHQPTRAAENGKAVLIFDNARNVALLQTITHSCPDRNPQCKGNTSSVIFNNLFSNTQTDNSLWNDPPSEGQKGPITASLRGNWYRKGPSTPGGLFWLARSRYLQSGSQLYMADNFNDGEGQFTTDFYVINGEGVNPLVGSEPIGLSGYTVLPGSTMLDYLPSRVGAWPLQRDTHETRLIAEVLARGGATISTQTAVGGWPTYATTTRSLTLPPASTRWDVMDAVGRTRFEYWLEDYATALEVA